MSEYIDPPTRRREMLGRIAAARGAIPQADHNGNPLAPATFEYDSQGKLKSAERGEPFPEPKPASVPGSALPGVSEARSLGSATGYRGLPSSAPSRTTPIAPYDVPRNPRREAAEER